MREKEDKKNKPGADSGCRLEPVEKKREEERRKIKVRQNREKENEIY